ncbi:MAG: ispH [Acidimicrobiia bacterium]|nr:ispH [Acidimicrobiia bacterium]
MRVQRLIVAEPQGFCAGVEVAVKALAWILALNGPPVYCVHEIVHNETVADRFRRLGVVFVDDVADAPIGATVVLSAHGSSPATTRTARARAALVIDAICPLVAKVHREVRLHSEAGHRVLYLGHRGHDEAEAVLAIAPDHTTAVATAAEMAALPRDGREVAVLAQTTLTLEAYDEALAGARLRFGHVHVPPRGDICYATTNRQAAVRAVAGRCDSFVVVGSARSSNTNALCEVARASGCEVVVRVDGVGALPPLSGVVGLTAGASAPAAEVEAVIAALNPLVVERVRVSEEPQRFLLPSDLRDLLTARLLDDSIPEAVRELVEREPLVTSEELLVRLEGSQL